MATPNPNKDSATTKQITFAAFKRYVKTMEDSPLTPDEETITTAATQGDNTSPVGSPSAITPTPATEPDLEDLWAERTTASSTRHHQNGPLKKDITAEQVRAFETMAMDLGHSVEDTNPDNDRVTNVVVNRLILIGDEFDQQLSGHRWSTILRAFRSTDGSVITQFSNTIISLKKELSLQMIVKIFYFGYRLLTTIQPLDFYTEQQMRIVRVFTNFLLSELSDWIDQQGGWETILSNDHLRSYSTSDLPDRAVPYSPICNYHVTHGNLPFNPSHNNSSPILVQRHNSYIGTPPSVRSNSCSESRPVSSSVCIPRARPRQLPLQPNMPHSYPRQSSREMTDSPPTTPTISRSSFGSVVSFGIGFSFGIALCTFFFSK